MNVEIIMHLASSPCVGGEFTETLEVLYGKEVIDRARNHKFFSFQEHTPSTYNQTWLTVTGAKAARDLNCFSQRDYELYLSYIS